MLRLAELDPVLDDEGRLVWSPLEAQADTIFLGLEGDAPLFAPLVKTEAFGQRAWGVFRLLALMSPRDAAIWGAARSLNEWHNRHCFCGICGAPTEAFRAGWHAWGLQFHPEVDGPALDGWYRGYRQWVGEAGTSETSARSADARFLTLQAVAAERLFGAFADVVVSVAERSSAERVA